MGVFRALILRASSLFAFLLAVKWIGESGMNTSALPLCLLMSAIFLFLLGCINTNKTSPLGVFFFIVKESYSAIFFAVLYVQVGCFEEVHHIFLRDNALPFVNIQVTAGYLLQEVTTLCFYIYSYLRLLGINPEKIKWYVFCLTVNSVVIIFILEHMFTYAIHLTLFATKLNFYHGVDNIYPPGHSQALNLDKNLFRGNVSTKDKYLYGHNGEMLFQHSLGIGTSDSIFNSTGKALPYVHQSIDRYAGEDVVFECSFMITDPSLSVKWLLDNKMLQLSHRHDILVQKDIIHSEGSEVNVNVYAKLCIRHLKKSEFGRYDCICQTTTYNYTIITSIKEVIKIVMSVFYLNLIKRRVHILHRVVGNLMPIYGLALCHKLDVEGDISDIYAHYTINNEPVESVCSTQQVNVCSVGAELFKLFTQLGAETESAEKYYCLCSNGYGIHRIVLLRQVFLTSKVSYRVIEIQLPIIFIVLPDVSTSMFRVSDDMDAYSEIENIVHTEKNIDKIDEKIKDKLKLLSLKEEKILWKANIIQSILTIFCFCLLYIGIRLFVIAYNEISNMILRYIFILNQIEGPPITPAIERITYDIFVSHSVEKLTFVTEKLAAFLENECNIKVCIPDRDFQPGKSLFRSNVECIQNSRRVIIVLSREYVREPRCMMLQLEHIILPLIYDGNLQGKQLLVIKYDEQCEVPQLLKWNSDVSVLNWTEYLHDDVKLKSIQRWLQTGKLQ